ncbi:MAG: sigma 54-dependent Fis family transcriptional regulator, partial [Deltaproteobacteria bacterium]|nr:sigma 54-dependent Fis family transcriptional regulator [Deltaproteobacteria bacterium]
MEGQTKVTYRGDTPELAFSSALLRVIRGPNTGASAALGLERVIVGSGEGCEIQLEDAEVSHQHLEVRLHDKGFRVADLGSTNGSFYRGARLEHVVVGVGAELRVGQTILRIDRGPERSVSFTQRAAFGSLVGSAPVMQSVFGMLEAVASTDATVLVLGETGTGKELVTREVHRHSPRHNKALVVLDCGSIPTDLIESELFGHEKGAFTGATESRAGIFERGDGGTVFLDEIGELPLEMQTRLLRVLDQRTVRRVGGRKEISVDFRIVAATHRDIEAYVTEGRFRQDLYYRLAVIQVRLPPLRERLMDIPLLAHHFLEKAGCADPDAVLTPEVLEVLATRRWPGNARELRNVVERAVVLRDSAAEVFADGRESTSGASSSGSGAEPPGEEDESWVVRHMPRSWLDQPYKEAKARLLKGFERHYLNHLVARHGTNISRIAAEAQVDRHLVRKLLRKHGLLDDESGEKN